MRSDSPIAVVSSLACFILSTLGACMSCRHRKIKCDGERPCEACRWYTTVDQGHYSDHGQPGTMSNLALDGTSRQTKSYLTDMARNYQQHEMSTSSPGQLLPDVTPEAVVNLPREKLLEPTVSSPYSSSSQGSVPHPILPANSGSLEGLASPLSKL